MQRFHATSVEEAVKVLIPYLEDTSSAAHKSIYFDGWRDGVAASAVLRAIAENPAPSLRKKFDRIIHVDCSRWKNPRQLQRAIADQLNLPQHVMDLFDRQDEEDDFNGVEESSRAEIADIRREIYRTFMDLTCLLILNNGSDHTLDIASFGFPLNDWYNLRDNRLLWTFRGRLRLNPKIAHNVDSSHLNLFVPYYYSTEIRKVLLAREAEEITQYSGELHLDGTKAAECCLYLLSLNYRGGHIMDYNWATHACNYWVCDGIITVQEEKGGGSLQEDQAWELAAALHQEIHLEDYSSNTAPDFGYALHTPPNRWILVTQESDMKNKPTLDTTSLFIAFRNIVLLPDDMFHQANKVQVLRLCNCAFNFSSPPFHCCHNLRFLGLDKCQDHRTQEAGEDKSNNSSALEIFQRLWVLDICYIDWELPFPTESTREQQMAMNIREVHINKGRIWRRNFAWRRLKNLRKLRVIEPTHPWGNKGEIDEFADMLKLEILDLSKNTMIQVLPSLCGASSLKTLILDDCVVLEQVGPQGLPPWLESFSFASREGNKAKISSISLAGCSSLVSFTLRGPLQNLRGLDLSGTMIKMLDLRDVQDSCIGQIILLRCEKLRTILWPEKGFPNLSMLHIDSLVCHVETEHQQAYATMMDFRFAQSLVLSNHKFCWNCNKTHINICNSSTPKETTPKKKTMSYYSAQKVVGSPLHMPIVTTTQPVVCYKDVNLAMISTIDLEGSSAPLHEPLDIHVEIGEGISYANVVSEQALSAVSFMMNKAESLHVHDNFSITSVNPKHVILTGDKEITWGCLKWCHIERCHKLNTVFSTDYTTYVYFKTLEAFSAAELMMANCIWSRGRITPVWDRKTFAKLRSIHLYYCPRLTFVFPLSWPALDSHLPSLETLHIVYCSELRQIFPVEAVALEDQPRVGVLKFPKLKHIHLHDVPKLHQICEISRMVAPVLETISVRGCWSLKRIPAIGSGHRSQHSRPIVDCEKNWWEKLEWEGMNVGHYPSLFEPRHSMYYKKALPRCSVLR
uniref:Disease resistance protein At4g27190-like leucine-rich repeats domain-containing protein n=1 Tax=Oryza barthii TaxID=65489 RepID=A0A0D3FSG7_9ORYZ